MPERQARPGQEQWQAMLQGQELLPEQARPGQEQEMLQGQALLPEQARPGQEQEMLQGQALLPEQARPGQEQEMLQGQALPPRPAPPAPQASLQARTPRELRRELSFPGRPPLLKENAPLRTETFRGALRLRRALQPERPSGGQLRPLPFLPSRPELGHSSS